MPMWLTSKSQPNYLDSFPVAMNSESIKRLETKLGGTPCIPYISDETGVGKDI